MIQCDHSSHLRLCVDRPSSKAGATRSFIAKRLLHLTQPSPSFLRVRLGLLSSLSRSLIGRPQAVSLAIGRKLDLRHARLQGT